MTYETRKDTYGEKLAKIVDIHLHKCKYTDDEWVAYGAGTLQTNMTPSSLGNILMSGTQATKFTEQYVWARLGGSHELVKCTVTDDLNLEVIARGDFGTNPVEHSAGTSITIIHSGEADGTCYGLTNCSAKNNYVKDLDLVFRFPSVNLELGEKYYHGMQSEKPSSPSVKPSESMGSRGKTSISILDGLDPDTYAPYPNSRTNNGTLWTKLIARNPYFEGRKVTVYDGFDVVPLNLDNFQKREYLIDDLQLDSGKVSIKCVDPLILTEDKKSKAPIVTPISLATEIIDASTEFDYRENVDFFFGPIGTQLYVRIDSEVILCEVAAEKKLTIITRAVKTDKKDHEIASTVQYVLYYEKQNVVAIIEDLLKNFTTIDDSFLDDYTDIKTKTSTVLLTAFISKSETVSKLIDELVRIGLLTMWFNPTRSKVEIKLSNDPSIEPISITEDDNIGHDTYKESRKPDDQITRSAIAYAPNDITKTSGEENFSVVLRAGNIDIELDQNKGEVNEPKVFFCRWLQDPVDIDEFIIATSMIDNEVNRNVNLPVDVEFDLDLKDVGAVQGGNLDLASVISLSTSRRVGIDGNPITRNFQVVNITNKDNAKRKIKAKLYQQLITGVDVDFTITENQENYVLADDPGFNPVADTNYSILIPNDVVIGGTSTTNTAFSTGVLPSGVTLTLYVQGSILGQGGAGGAGGFALCPNPNEGSFRDVGAGGNGFVGGDAISTTVPMDIYAGSGLIAGGGGGAAGVYSIAQTFGSIYVSGGNGGSGGQGYATSQGGAKGFADIDATIYTDEGVNGDIGSNSAPGSLGPYSGGRYGESGDDVTPGADIQDRFGGLAGFAIRSNGNSVIIKSGAVGLFGNIRGRID